MKSTNICANMSINNDWDVEKHKMEHECDEHWELRRKFLLAHKKKFPENELVCLAQVFSNVELLGCRYPKETMDLVAELSKEIAAEYREKQKTKLQRTFVKASEAASSKVKGCIAQISTIAEKPISNESNKKLKSEIEETETVNNNKRPSTSVIEFSSKKKRELPFGDIILVERPGDVPQNTLAHSVGISRNNLKWVYANQSTKFQHTYDCTIYIDSKKVAFASGYNRKFARKAASEIALDRLRKYYHTIKIKQSSDAQTNVNLMTIEKTKSQDNIPDDNIGKKLMKLMGWSGGGLGKSQQGIMEPVTLKQQLSREGLGLKSSSSNMHELKAKCRIAFKEFLMGDMQNDIVFSTDFTNDERAMIHQVARSMGLKSRSHGPSDRRKLVISRKVNIRSLVEELKSLGGTTEKYELIEPTYLDDELDSVDGITENYELTESTSLDEEMKDFEETEKYELIKPTSSIEELDKRYIAKKSTVTEKLVSNKNYKKLKSEIMDIKTVNDYKRPSTSVMEFPSKKEEDLPYGDIILVEKPGDVPETILKHSVGICGRNLKWTYTKLDNSCGYTIYINSNKVAFASDCDKQFAKNAASAIALDRLRKYYHTIKVKQNLNTQTNATLTTIKETKSQNVIHNDNAQKLMKLIGWSCEYLRNSEQGIMEPVMFEQLTRKDLGLKSCPSSPSNICELKAKCKIIFKKLLMGDIQNDIVFSMDFTNKEKEKMLQIARSMCLKSYIDCSSDQWKLVILHKVNIQSLLEKLKSLAGTTKTYELIQPTGLDDELDIVDGTIEKYESIESTSLDEKVKDPEHSIEKYESIKPTSLVEDTRCIAQTSIITEKAITNKINKKLKSEIEETETLNNDKKCSNSVMESLCKKKNLYGDIILVEKPGDVPEIILKHSVGTSNKNLKCEYTKIYNSWNYVVSINSKQVACASDCSRKRAKKAVLALALDELRKYYYTIKIKQNSDAQMNITLMTIKKLKSENIIPDDNIGKKLLKLMGWSGGGLGKSQQGIMEPVMFVQHFGRKGLGLKSSSSNIEYQELKAQCKIIFQKLLMGDIQKDIVFSTDFTNDEKTVIDEVARLMALKSRSHGPSDQRKLVISRKINIRTLFQELKSGRSNEKYELIEPTHLDDELDSVNGTTENYELTESTSLDAEVKDFEGTTEKYRESIEPTNLVEELDQKEPISNNQSNNKLQFEVQGTKTINNHKKSNASVMESPSKEKKDSPYGDIILVEKPGDVPETILKHSVGLCDANLKCIQTKLSESCTIYINSKQIACVSDCSRKRAREVVFALALDELRKYYHTIKIKQNPDPQKNVTLTKTEKLQTKMFDDNVEKLMKLIGWSHDSLRKSQQSIMESVTLQQQLSRESLGLKLSPSNKHELKAKCKIIFNKLLEEDKQNNIIFSTDFTVQEKKKIRKIVRLMGLKSCSYSSEQKLVILGRINIRNLFEELKSLAGTTEKYELIEPTNLDNKLDNIDGTTEVDSPSLDEEVKDLKEITEKYELTKPTSLVEELDKTCISQTSTIIDYKPVSDKTNKKLKSEIVDTETVSEHKCSSTSIMESSSKDTKDLLYGDIILVEKMGDIPRNTLTHSIGISNKNLRWEYTRFCNACKCTIYINSRQVACASDCTRRRAREAAFALALDELRKYYYTIKIKQNTDAQNVTLTTIEETMSQDNIRDGNIGEKLIKLMGRNGDRLRRSLQSMKKRVTLEQQLSRESLGLTSSSFSICELKAKCKITFEKFLIGDMQNNIVFSMDFTNYEKLIIHQVANSVGLESRNRGSHNQQELIISRKLNILSLVEELKSLGGTTKKYELIKPINLNDEMENIDGTTEKYKLTGLTNYEEMKN